VSADFDVVVIVVRSIAAGLRVPGISRWMWTSGTCLKFFSFVFKLKKNVIKN
jgi:hypothetical protein